MELHPGTYLGGRFQIERKLGEGGMGVVYSAFDLSTHQRVAVKSLSPDLMGSPEIVERFKREAQAMSSLQHPHIVQFLQWVDEPGVGWFIAMEFVQGRDIDKMIEQQHVISPAQTVDLILPVLNALAYAHGLGVIHRDIKPANIMLLDTGTVKVLDFGTAKMAGASQMTKVGQTIGTTVYMPLEQLAGQPISHQSDLYALGITIYEMLTGQVPYYHDDPIEQMKMMKAANPTPPSQVNPQIPRDFDAVVLRAIARDPKHRFRDAGEFYQALEGVKRVLQPQQQGGHGAPQQQQHAHGSDPWGQRPPAGAQVAPTQPTPVGPAQAAAAQAAAGRSGGGGGHVAPLPGPFKAAFVAGLLLVLLSGVLALLGVGGGAALGVFWLGFVVWAVPTIATLMR